MQFDPITYNAVMASRPLIGCVLQRASMLTAPISVNGMTFVPCDGSVYPYSAYPEYVSNSGFSNFDTTCFGIAQSVQTGAPYTNSPPLAHDGAVWSNGAYYSEDNGANWSITTGTRSATCKYSRYLNNKFYFTSNTNIVYHSADGKDISAFYSANGTLWQDITYANGYIVVVGRGTSANTARVMVSTTEGVSWTSTSNISLVTGASMFTSIAWNGSMWVATAAGCVYVNTSSNPTSGSWTVFYPRGALDTSLTNICVHNFDNLFVISNGVYSWTFDGTSFSAQAVPNYLSNAFNSSIAAASVKCFRTSDALYLADARWTTSGTGAIIKTTDGITWSAVCSASCPESTTLAIVPRSFGISEVDGSVLSVEYTTYASFRYTEDVNTKKYVKIRYISEIYSSGYVGPVYMLRVK